VLHVWKKYSRIEIEKRFGLYAKAKRPGVFKNPRPLSLGQGDRSLVPFLLLFTACMQAFAAILISQSFDSTFPANLR
jgi:hypothetical protein